MRRTYQNDPCSLVEVVACATQDETDEYFGPKAPFVNVQRALWIGRKANIAGCSEGGCGPKATMETCARAGRLTWRPQQGGLEACSLAVRGATKDGRHEQSSALNALENAGLRNKSRHLYPYLFHLGSPHCGPKYR
jgi:hypothetical protein